MPETTEPTPNAVANEMEREQLIKQLRAFIPDDLGVNDEEACVILRAALAANIIQLKKDQGMLFIQSKLSANVDQIKALAEALVSNKEQLTALHSQYKLLGGDPIAPEA